MQSCETISTLMPEPPLSERSQATNLPNAQNSSQSRKSSNHHEQCNVLLRPDVPAPRRTWKIAIMLRLADRGIFMLPLPLQAAVECVHLRNTWAGIGVVIMPAQLDPSTFREGLVYKMGG